MELSGIAYIALALILVLTVAVIVLIVMLSSVKREVNDTRKESMQFNQNTYEAVNRALSDSALRQDNELDAIRKTMEERLGALQSDNNAQLEKMRMTVDEKLQKTLEDRISKSFDTVRKSLEQVYQGLGDMQNLAQGVGDLKKVLSNVKTRGVLGEVQLGAILEQILAPSQYVVNAQVKPDTQERVEYAVKMPGDGEDFVFLPIDAKFPGDVYASLMNAYESADSALIDQARKQLVTFLKSAAKDINTKYIEPPYTTDFAVMFLPFEGLYAEAINLGFMEYAQREYKVMLAGPSTMSALLNSLQMGFKTLAIQKHSGEVWKVLDAVKGEFDKFADVLAATQNKLNQANADLDKLIGVRTRGIQRSLRDVQNLGNEDELE